MDPWAFHLLVGGPDIVTMPDGSNVRKVVADTVHDVQQKILEVDEGDTMSIRNIIQVIIFWSYLYFYTTADF